VGATLGGLAAAVADRTGAGVAVREAGVEVPPADTAGARVAVAVLAAAALRPGVALGATLAGEFANWQPLSVTTASRPNHTRLAATGIHRPRRN